VIRIENILHLLQLFHFHLWPIYWPLNHYFSALGKCERTACRSGCFTPGKEEEAPDTHWIGGWVRLRAGLDAVESRRSKESNPGRRFRSQALYRLSYIGSWNNGFWCKTHTRRCGQMRNVSTSKLSGTYRVQCALWGYVTERSVSFKHRTLRHPVTWRAIEFCNRWRVFPASWERLHFQTLAQAVL
jgi:hypothetical protein